MVTPLLIEPNGIYDDSSIYLSVGITPNALSKARRHGRLKFSRPGQRCVYLGQWLIDWLEAEAADNPLQSVQKRH